KSLDPAGIAWRRPARIGEQAVAIEPDLFAEFRLIGNGSKGIGLEHEAEQGNLRMFFGMHGSLNGGNGECTKGVRAQRSPVRRCHTMAVRTASPAVDGSTGRL